MKTRSVILGLLCICIFSCKKNSGDSDPEPAINPWDGRYLIEGTLTDFKEPVYVWPGTYEYSLQINSPTQATLISKDLGMAGHLLKNGINLTFYGTFGIVVNFDPATNKITSLTNSYGQPSGSGRSAVLDPSGVNSWDPVSKNIRIKYWMDEVGFAGHRTAFDETWVYIGAR